MSELRRAWLFLLLSAPILACAQQFGSSAEPSPLAQGISARPAADSADGLIKLDVVVTDKSGKPVSGLEGKDFTLLDNGEPNKILSFQAFDGISAKPDPPVEVILVIDAANHSKDQISDEQFGIGKFLRQNGGHLAQPTSIYRVSESGLSVTLQPSTDGNALAAEISRKNGLREISLENDDLRLQNSSFQNQVLNPQTALRALGSIVLIERRKPGRKLLVWVCYGTPGEENYGRGTGLLARGEARFDWITEFSTRLREAHIALFGVTFWKSPDRRFPYQDFLPGVTSSEQANPGNLAFEVLATQSGGLVAEKPNNDLASLIDNCVEDASAFYTLSFDPPLANTVDEYHDLKLDVARPGLVVRTSTGYYDQPVYYDQPYVPAERVTVAQLEQALTKAQGSSDAEIARQLSAMELTERLSSTGVSSWKSHLPGTKSRAALVAVAAASAFLDPPPAEISANPPPDLIAQRLMQSKIIDYLLQTIPKLPDFFATRTTVHFEEPTPREGQTWKTAMGDRSLHLVGSSQATVLYRHGYEVVELGTKKEKKPEQGQERLNTRGTFGPILSVVILDAARNDLAWSRWEQGAGGLLAVFHYEVPKEQSHYEVTYRGIQSDGDGIEDFRRLIGYHGDITINPVSGAIMRMTLEGDLDPRLPILRSSILVEYGPVEIAGSNHICLVRSASIARVRTIFGIHEWGESLRVYGPYETMLDDVAFGKYHMFHGEARVLPGYDPTPPEK
jgi:VWFA-related protein